jgi:hypothetical protein
MSKAMLNIVAENPQIEHIPDDVTVATMHEHR